jgi:hypothetical protein
MLTSVRHIQLTGKSPSLGRGYGLKLGREEIESVAIWQNDDGWDKALTAGKPWLLYDYWNMMVNVRMPLVTN